MTKPISVIKRDNWNYAIPAFKVGESGLEHIGFTEIALVRGSRQELNLPSQEGITSEGLLTLVIDYLKSVNVGELATRETSAGITNIEQGLMWLQKRHRDREDRGVAQTYQK